MISYDRQVAEIDWRINKTGLRVIKRVIISALPHIPASIPF